jgi:hypothetical protein
MEVLGVSGDGEVAVVVVQTHLVSDRQGQAERNRCKEDSEKVGLTGRASGKHGKSPCCLDFLTNVSRKK